jgi:hypothetical protein
MAALKFRERPPKTPRRKVDKATLRYYSKVAFNPSAGRFLWLESHVAADGQSKLRGEFLK